MSTSLIFGNLTWGAIPWSNTLVMTVLAVVAVIGFSILAAITYFKKWGYLWREWLTTVDHKKLGVMYIILALVMLLRGFSDAFMMRTQLAVATGGASGYLPPEHFDQIFSAHGVIMIIFMAMPFMIGLMNLILPLQIGARDVAYPFMNNLSFWLTFAGVFLVMISLGVGEFAKTGWVAYPPLSGKEYSPGVGVDYYLWALLISGIGTTMTGINFVMTILKMRTKSMKLMQMPIFVWTCLWSNVLIMAAFPILTAVLAMLALDRYLDFHFFTTTLGGNPMMYINLFWAWGHPEVYILILPAFGIFSEVVSTFTGKRLFGYTSMVVATGAIAVLSFLVWLHHFFTMGSTANVNAFFGIMTMIIAVPTGVKLINWLLTMFRGRIRFEEPMLWTIGFMVTFTIGGMTGVLLAVPGADYVLHNSLFLIAHFHNTLIGGALFGFFAGYTYWFPKAMGLRLDPTWGKRAFWLWITGFYVAFMPLYVLGFMGMTRRMNHTNNPEWTPWLIAACIGMFIIFAGIISQIIQLVVTYRHRKSEKLLDKTGDPWDGRTLEWGISSPPPIYNFAHFPKVSDRDAYAMMKKEGLNASKIEHYQDIELPKNTSAGFLIAGFFAVFGFAMVWHIWWLAIVCLIAAFVVFLVRCCQTDVEFKVGAEEVARTERAHEQTLIDAGVIRSNS